MATFNPVTLGRTTELILPVTQGVALGWVNCRAFGPKIMKLERRLRSDPAVPSVPCPAAPDR
jgi:hypothetical protein